MTTPSNEQSLEGLIERVKAATGPDRHLDALIEVEARRQEAYRVGLNDQQRAKWQASRNGSVTDGHVTYFSHTFTASVDAALALVERCLPGAGWYVARGVADGMPATAAALYPNIKATQPIAKATGETPALAILIALLTALKDAS